MDSLATLASLALAGYAALYLLACAVFPFGACRRCKGTGKRRSPFGRARSGSAAAATAPAAAPPRPPRHLTTCAPCTRKGTNR